MKAYDSTERQSPLRAKIVVIPILLVLASLASALAPAGGWEPVADVIRVPRSGVKLKGGLFEKAMENNVTYLLESFSVEDMLWPFRLRAGQKDPPRTRPVVKFWETELEGSVAGRFLMGAGNTLRWREHPELRRRLNAVVDGIEACRRDDGYLMAFPPEMTLDQTNGAERANYTRAWVTHGLIEAGYAGNPKAFRLLREYYNWFNQCEYLPKVLRTLLGYQGMIANSRMFFTPVGQPRDIEVLQKYYQENYWLNQLAARDERAIWEYPYNRPHCYCITAFEAYMDMYRATGDRRYLDAVEGGWKLINGAWEHVGGSIAICEFLKYPPRSYYITRKEHTGEYCGSAFWIFLNQRFHLLNPDEERYVSEIEKSIYNIGLSNQAGGKGIRYHAILHGKKDPPDFKGTCCEGQATRVLGALPEFIYSLASDGVYVNLFEPSELTWQQRAETFRLDMTTNFPFGTEVAIRVSVRRPAASRIRIRVPSWAAKDMPIEVNGKQIAVGKRGAYQALERTWTEGDTIRFSLPADFRVTEYSGADNYPDRKRFAVEFGPVLLAAVGPLQAMSPTTPPFPADPAKTPGFEKDHLGDYCLVLKQGPKTVRSWMKPKSGQPLHFTVDDDPQVEYMPYWEVGDRYYTCYPVMEDNQR